MPYLCTKLRCKIATSTRFCSGLTLQRYGKIAAHSKFYCGKLTAHGKYLTLVYDFKLICCSFNVMNCPETITDRINQYLEAKKISRRAFSSANGFDPSKINRQLKGESALSTETLEGFVNTYEDINLFWLMLGEGPMLVTDVEEDPEPAHAPVMVRADHVADVTPDAPAPSFHDAAAPAYQSPALNLAEALQIIKSQQDIIERQAAMLERLVSHAPASGSDPQPLNPIKPSPE